ncbi:hypothetical protein LENED_008983 [Lentinula edodes]|uniref:Uncharacterized protein n=1 Tax=Lentinula edodes TaxID=5353 RepID=A0A1Q3EIK7_LENED|nr:hypothetical protein LENED_008983 [Lentinula edodes]
MTRYHVVQHERAIFSPPDPAAAPPALTHLPVLHIPSESEASSDASDLDDDEDVSSVVDDMGTALDNHGDREDEEILDRVGQSLSPVESNFDLNELGIHAQWMRMEKIILTNWTPSDDLETDGEDSVRGDDDIPFPLEDENPLDDDLEEDNFWDFGEFDWKQFQEYGGGGRLPASEQVRAGYFNEFSKIENKLSAYDLAIC